MTSAYPVPHVDGTRVVVRQPLHNVSMAVVHSLVHQSGARGVLAEGEGRQLLAGERPIATGLQEGLEVLQVPFGGRFVQHINPSLKPP